MEQSHLTALGLGDLLIVLRDGIIKAPIVVNLKYFRNTDPINAL